MKSSTMPNPKQPDNIPSGEILEVVTRLRPAFNDLMRSLEGFNTLIDTLESLLGNESSPIAADEPHGIFLRSDYRHAADVVQELLAQGPVDARKAIDATGLTIFQCCTLRKHLGIISTRIKAFPKICVWHYPHQQIDPVLVTDLISERCQRSIERKLKPRSQSPTEHPFAQTMPGIKRSRDAVPRKQPTRRQHSSPPPPSEKKVINEYPVKVIYRPKAEIDSVFDEAREKDGQTVRYLIGDDAG